MKWFGLTHRAMHGRIGLALLFSTLLSTFAVLADEISSDASQAEPGAQVRLRIVGSGYTMPVFVQPWAEEFEARSGISVEVLPTGTSTAPPALLAGDAEIAAMTRPLHEAEARALEQAFGGAPLVWPVAEDQVAVFVNRENPIEQLTLAELDAVYSKARRCGATEDITRWGALLTRAQIESTGWMANRAISLFGRRTGSGTGSFFRERALCDGEFKDWMRISPGRESAALGVAESKFGIGFGSLRDQKKGMKVVAIAETSDGPFVRPGEGSTGAASYALGRTLNFVIPVRGDVKTRKHVLDFLEFVYSESSQAGVVKVGFNSVNPELLKTRLDRIAELRR